MAAEKKTATDASKQKVDLKLLPSDLAQHIKAMTRLIYFVTPEEDRFLKNFRNAMKPHEDRIWVYNATLGLLPIAKLVEDWETKAHETDKKTEQIADALKKIYVDDPGQKEHFYLITDPERWLKDDHNVRRILNIFHQLHNDNSTVKVLIFVGSRRFIPEKLQRYMEVVYDKGLSAEDTSKYVTTFCKEFKAEVPEESAKLFRGMTSYEIQQAITGSIVQTKKKDVENSERVDPQLVADYRRRQFQKTDLVQYIDTSKFSFDQVGGLARLKEWARKTSATWTTEGQNFGLTPPKGVLFVGVYGCGKSLSVKALAHHWNLPLVQFEMGRLRSSGVGDTEANVYKCLQIIESAAPCVTGETQVTLANGGTRSIEELWQEGPDDLVVQCWNEKTLRVTTTKVQAITRREAEAFEVSASNGFKLNATANHQHYVMRGGMPEWVRTDELTPGDMLAVPISKYVGTTDCSKHHPKGMRVLSTSNGLSEFRRGGGGFRDGVVPHLPNRWSSDLGWLLGVIEGDGFISKADTIGLVNTSTEALSKFERIMLEAFGLQCVRRETNLEESTPNLPGLSANPVFEVCYNTVVTNQLAAEFLRSARQEVLVSSFEARAGFLAGWIDADGCIGPHKVVLTVKGPKLRWERRLLARQLIQSLGVVPSKFEGQNIEITGSRALALAKVLTKHLAIKSSKADKVTSSDIGFDRGMGFACGRLLTKARQESGLKHSEIPISTNVTWGYETGRVPLSERHLANYLEVYGESSANLKSLLEADCRWVSIKSITSIGEHPVYDLVCTGADTRNFFANGVITHNCILWMDEAEKGLSGGASSGSSDAGTTSRALGILSTWVQETSAPVCIVMTANSLKGIPTEMVNRMTERFFVDIPDNRDRIDILKIHLKAVKQDLTKFNFAVLADASNDLVGRELDQAIQSAMTESFAQKKPALDQDILEEELKRKPRIVKTMGDEIQEIISWVGYDAEVDDGIRARLASDRRNTMKVISSG